MRKFELKNWEIALVVLSGLVMTVAFGLYVTNFPVRKYFGAIDEEESQVKVGKIQLLKGQVRREIRGEGEFKALTPDSSLYNQDTIVTGADSSAGLVLDDGSTIEIGPSAMVRLSFESSLSIDGISRRANIDVVAGKVTGTAKTHKIVLRSKNKLIALSKNKKETLKEVAHAPLPMPSRRPKLIVITPPPPSPKPPNPNLVSQVTLTLPENGSRLEVPRGSLSAERPINFAWKISPPDRKVRFLIRKPDGKPLFQQTIAAKAGRGSAYWVATHPGKYVWELTGEDGKPLVIPPAERALEVRSSFTVKPEFEAIQALDPLVGGLKTNSNAIQEKRIKDFDLTLQWNPYPGAKKYVVWVANSPKSKRPILKKWVSDTSYTLNKGKVYQGQIFYRITAPLPNGFRTISETKPFIFSFLPPTLVIPADRAQFQRKILGMVSDKVLLTWQKTNFTDQYELEIAQDLVFEKIFLSLKIAENFYVLEKAPPGKYFWRVRGISTSISSVFSKPYEFTIVP